ncbi:AAA family ATPase [Myxococcota bacterium]|nr:AAA family ATPase [Myxococcota bacterium]
MQIRKIKLQNLKLFRDFELDLVDPRTHRPRQWTLVVGKNGRGKSTLLQAIALATLGVNQANSVAQGSLRSLRDAREGAGGREVTIDAELELPALPRRGAARSLAPWGRLPVGARLRSTLSLRSESNELGGVARWATDGMAAHTVDPLVEARRLGLPGWFVSGYGVTRSLHGVERVLRSERPAEDRVAGLFRPYNLIGLGFTELIEEQGRGAAFRTLVRQALTHHAALIPELRNVELRGRGGLRTTAELMERRRFEMRMGGATLYAPPTWLSHGYQASIAWIADLIGQYFLDVNGEVGTAPRTEHLSGLVLIDELDLFLHPEWQAQLIDALSTTFPNVQFIATTHSPILVSGRRRSEIVSLELDENGDVMSPRPIQYDPRLLTPGELYRQVLGLHDTPPGPVADLLDDYRALARDPLRDDAEEEKVHRLRAELMDAELSPLPEILPRARG